MTEQSAAGDGPAKPTTVDLTDAGEVLKPQFRPAKKRRFERKRNDKPFQNQERSNQNSYQKSKPANKGKVVARGFSHKLRIIPLGGSNDVGEKNMIAYEYGNDIVIVDAGIEFADDTMPGVDGAICDTTYLEENKDRLRAFVVTHGHEDHIGGFPYIWPKLPLPIYTAPLTAGLIKAKFEEHGIAGYEFRIIKPGEKIQIGSFTLEPVRLTHSIPDILGLALTTPVGTVFHATDWKIDFTPAFGDSTDFAKLAELSERGVLALLSDSTNVMEPGYTMSEQVVSRALLDIFESVKGRTIVSSFSSRIDRIQHVITACAKTGKKLAISGRSMERNINIAMELGYLKVPQNVLVDIRNINNMPDDKTVVMCTGSQGEEFSALVRMSTGEHRHIKIKKGDTVILSASQVPGNERAVGATINNLYREGAEVITNKELDVHSSGHAHREEIKLFLTLLKPKYLIPIHGDYRRFVEHAKLAEQVGIARDHSLILENGQVAEFDEQGFGQIASERVQVGQILIDGSGVGDVGEIVIRDRQTMAKDGLFAVLLTVDNKTGRLLSSPDIISRGFVYMRESEELIEGARDLVKKLHQESVGKKQANWDGFKKVLRDKMGDYLYKHTQRSPMVIAVVVQV